MAKRNTTRIKLEDGGETGEGVMSNAEKFDSIFSALKSSKKVAIFTHSMPDPDGMASAHALRWLLKKKYGAEARVFHEGQVSHQQNKTMANVLEIGLEQASEFAPDKFEKVIIVDATTANTPLEKADVVIDHHRVNESGATECAFIEAVGAASTLVYELIGELGVGFDDDMDAKVATALFFGIRNDTADLVSEAVTDRDYQASFALWASIDRPRLEAVVNYPLPSYFFDAEKTINAEGNSEISNSFFVGTLGMLPESKRDALPMIADKMMRVQGIDTAVVFALVEDDRIEACVRSKNPSLDVNQFCKKIFGKDFSGGKPGAGAAKVPLGIIGCNGLPNELKTTWWETQKKALFYKLIHAAGN